MSARVSVDDASRRLGITANAVRKRLRAGKLTGVKDARGAWRIPVDSLPLDREVAPLREKDRHQDRAAETQELGELRVALDAERRINVDLRDRVAAQEGYTQTLNTQLATLTTAVTGLTALSVMQRQLRLASWWSRLRRGFVVGEVADG
jgi:hypothetical protein